MIQEESSRGRFHALIKHTLSHHGVDRLADMLHTLRCAMNLPSYNRLDVGIRLKTFHGANILIGMNKVEKPLQNKKALKCKPSALKRCCMCARFCESARINYDGWRPSNSAYRPRTRAKMTQPAVAQVHHTPWHDGIWTSRLLSTLR